MSGTMNDALAGPSAPDAPVTDDSYSQMDTSAPDAPVLSPTDAAGAAAAQMTAPSQPTAMDGSTVQPTATGGTPAPAPAPKQSLWRTVLAGALQGLAGSAGARSFGGGISGGAAAELNAKAQSRQQAKADAVAMDQHTKDQAQVAMMQANTAHVMQMTQQLEQADKNKVLNQYNEQTKAGLESGALVPAGPAGSHDQVLAQILKLHKSDPSSYYMPIQTAGPDGKMTWQAVKAPNAPIQSDVTLNMPDGTNRTFKAGTITGQQYAAMLVDSAKQTTVGLLKKQTQAAKPDNTMKVTPYAHSATGFAYMSPDKDTGELTTYRGDAPAPSASTFAGTKTLARISPEDGLPHSYKFDPNTKDFTVDEGISTTGAFGGMAAKAAVIYKSGEDLKSAIRENAKDADATQLGTLDAWVKEKGITTPIGDPKLAKIQGMIQTYVALQPGFHGFRSQEAIETFHKAVGYLHTNPDVLIASIDAIGGTAKNANPTLRKMQVNQNSSPSSNNGKISVQDPKGGTHYFNDQASADKFKTLMQQAQAGRP